MRFAKTCFTLYAQANITGLTLSRPLPFLRTKKSIIKASSLVLLATPAELKIMPYVGSEQSDGGNGWGRGI